ncbi:MAG: HlyC/CorC family transporter [Rhodospirillales bacterium]|nr:HlyC/CorC family transporter [Alphaproteobacteria bacterium]MCB9987442.1 HlyC/CorC family transporter [Rhodospirillales bacterium]USO07578.1 MAG: HlyC/CorC family transporter [Rhodospirillales bacterium]
MDSHDTVSAAGESGEDAHKARAQPALPVPRVQQHTPDTGFFMRMMRFLFGSQKDRAFKEAIAEVISEDHIDAEAEKTALHQRLLISNVLKLKDMRAFDVMVPRADIVGIEVNTPAEDVLALLSQRQFSRLPVYRDTLDDVIGTVHIKDILSKTMTGEPMVIAEMVRDVPVISPAMPVLDLLLMMKQQRRHMALVVDEYGGIDGLVTINDIVETIVGEIDDEYYTGEDDGELMEKSDGSIIADGRVDLETFEQRFGRVLSEDEREHIDTLAGLVAKLAGRVPARGEVLTHPAGLEFEVLDADPRRIHRLRIRHVAMTTSEPEKARA